MIWHGFNAAISIVVGLIMAYKLGFLHAHFSTLERVGMGLLGAGCVMTIGPILWPQSSPYESWSGFLMRFGICLFFVGRIVEYDLHRKKG